MSRCKYKYCKKEYALENNDYSRAGFCSDSCGQQYHFNELEEAHRDVWHKEIHHWGTTYCLRCGKAIYVGNKSYSNTKKFPSFCLDCQKRQDEEAKKQQEKHSFEYTLFQCDWCGKSYYRKGSTAIKEDKYCSKRCEAHL